MKTISTKFAPAAVGPYSQAVEANGFIFCAGQIGMHPKTGILAEGLENQIKQIMANISAVLKAAGTNLSNVVKANIYVTNMADFPKVNEVYGSYFTDNKPARVTIGVASLPKGALVEIEVIAVKNNS